MSKTEIDGLNYNYKNSKENSQKIQRSYGKTQI